MTVTTKPELIWARIGEHARTRHVWFGLGLLSDLGLPIDVLQMFLAAKSLCDVTADRRPVTVLLADAHALAGGEDPLAVSRRAAIRTEEVQRIGAMVGLPVRVLPATQMDEDEVFRGALASALSWCSGSDLSYSNYTIRGVADVLYLCRGGGVKVGWSRSANIAAGHGRHHEPETDALALSIDRDVRAVYVRHGVTLDSSRPNAVPYTEKAPDTRHRLMLTGGDRGHFAAKLSDPAVSNNRRKPVIAHLSVTIAAFESLVGELHGNGVLEKATEIVAKLNRP